MAARLPIFLRQVPVDMTDENRIYAVISKSIQSDSPTRTSLQSARWPSACSPKCTGPSLRKRREGLDESDPSELMLDVRSFC